MQDGVHVTELHAVDAMEPPRTRLVRRGASVSRHPRTPPSSPSGRDDRSSSDASSLSSSGASPAPRSRPVKRSRNGARATRFAITFYSRAPGPVDADAASGGEEEQEEEEAGRSALRFGRPFAPSRSSRSRSPGRDEGQVSRGDGRHRPALPDLRQEAERLGGELRQVLLGDKQIVYAVWQVEKAPSTGRLHCQGYVRYSSHVAESRVRALVSPGHVEVCSGSEEQNVAYCSKEETRVAGPWSFGEPAKQGKRKDIDVVREVVRGGGGMRAVIENASSYQAAKFGELLLKYQEKGRDFEPEVRWYYGSTGSGKTKAAFDEFPDAWFSQKDGQWFDGYDAHEVAVFDDFRKDFCKFHTLLRLLDRYPYRIENKGGSRQFLARVIIITCPWAPDVLYSNRDGEEVAQLERRIHVLKLFGNVVPAPSASSSGASAPNFRASR